MNYLLLEDELPAARQLAKMIESARPGWRLLETIDSVAGAVRWLERAPAPDLVFMDIQLADGLSMDVFRQTSIAAPVIFTTAFDHFAVQAFKVNALDYLLKPIDPLELERALSRFEQRQIPGVAYDTVARILQRPQYKERFMVKAGQYFAPLSCNEIAFIRSSDGLTQAFTLQGKRYFIEHTLEELERLLDPDHFFRVGRGIMVRLPAVKKVHPHLNGRLKIETEPPAPEEIFVSRDRVPAFKAWLGA